MKAVFLDFATIDAGDLDVSVLRSACGGSLELHGVIDTMGIPALIADMQIVLANKAEISRKSLEGATALRIIALAATGTNNVDLDAARERGIAVCNIRDYCTASVVQHVLGVILALTHRFHDYSRAVSAGEWGRRPQFTMLDYPIRELRGRTLGVVGYGTLGRAVARACEQALGMKVIVAQRAGTDASNEGGAKEEPSRLPLADVLREADVLTLHCPLTPQTRGMIGAAELASMKRDAILVNTARGALVDLDALATALRTRQIAGAAIDVLPVEPPVEGSPLFAPDLGNLIVTPHNAWAAREARQRALDEMALNVRDFLAGGRRNRVD